MRPSVRAIAWTAALACSPFFAGFGSIARAQKTSSATTTRGTAPNPIPSAYNVNPIPSVYNVNPIPSVYNVNPIPSVYNVNPIPSAYNVNPIPSA